MTIDWKNCRECGRWKSAEWFLSESLCKKCAGKRRTGKNNPLVKLSSGHLVTRNVERKLERVARMRASFLTWKDFVGYFVAHGFLLGIIAGCALIVMGVVEVTHWYLVVLGVALLVIVVKSFHMVSTWVEAPRQNAKQEAVKHLARERQLEIETRGVFYGSSEWRRLREKIIQRLGRRCAKCDRWIPIGKELTVDHKKPRSKFKELALDEGNLQVLCRTCNSQKGNRIVD